MRRVPTHNMFSTELSVALKMNINASEKNGKETEQKRFNGLNEDDGAMVSLIRLVFHPLSSNGCMCAWGTQ